MKMDGSGVKGAWFGVRWVGVLTHPFLSVGDPYPLQLMPTTMAAAAAATPGLGPLQLQVSSGYLCSYCFSVEMVCGLLCLATSIFSDSMIRKGFTKKPYALFGFGAFNHQNYELYLAAVMTSLYDIF